MILLNGRRVVIIGGGAMLGDLVLESTAYNYTTNTAQHKAGTVKRYYFRDAGDLTLSLGSRTWALNSTLFSTDDLTKNVDWDLGFTPGSSNTMTSSGWSMTVYAVDDEKTKLGGNLYVLSGSATHLYEDDTGSPEQNELTGTITMAGTTGTYAGEINGVCVEIAFNVQVTGIAPWSEINSIDQVYAIDQYRA